MNQKVVSQPEFSSPANFLPKKSVVHDVMPYGKQLQYNLDSNQECHSKKSTFRMASPIDDYCTQHINMTLTNGTITNDQSGQRHVSAL